MKKTSLIFLTLVASFSVTMSVAQTDTLKNNNLSDFIYEPERLNTPPVRVDTNKRDTVRRDSVRVQPQAQVTYNYYYRSRFWNWGFRVFAPGRYYRVVNRPGFVPRHIREGGTTAPHFRHPGGFGRTGGGRHQSN